MMSYADSSYAPAFALVLDPVAGTIRPVDSYSITNEATGVTYTGTFFEMFGLPAFPSFTLKPGTTWDCHACNVFLKDTAGTKDEWGFRDIIEVVPVLDSSAFRCVDLTTGQPGDYSTDGKCDYDTKEHRNAACDPCCDCLPILVTACPGVVGREQTCQGDGITGLCTGGRTGSGAVGPSREKCCTLTDALAVEHDVCFVVFFDGDVWKMEVWCDDVLESTVTADVENCCPFGLQFSATITCIDCDVVVCVGADCEPPEPPSDVCCATSPDTLYAYVVSTEALCDLEQAVIELTRTVGENWEGFHASMVDSTSWALGCAGAGVWTITASGVDRTFTPPTATGYCDPVDVTFTGTMSGLVGDDCNSDLTVVIREVP